MGPDTGSDRPSPRGGGPAADMARVLLEQSAPGMLTDEHAMAAWIGAARATLRELIRDA